MKRAIIFDLDGTLANNKHRVHWLEGEKKDWDRFYSEMHRDTPNKPITWLCKALIDYIYRLHISDKGDLRVFIFTGRPENYRKATAQWLEVYLPWGFDLITLVMRQEGDYRPDYQVKQEMLDKLKSEGYEVLFTVDDRKQVVDMWRRNGITCLQCDEGDF